MISRVHIWRRLTGGGLPVEYLRWLSAMWERYDGPAMLAEFSDHLSPREARQAARADFDNWLVMICND